jgi:hypothetical protein
MHDTSFVRMRNLVREIEQAGEADADDEESTQAE